MRNAETLGKHDTGSRMPLIVGLETGQDQIELLRGHRPGQRIANRERISGAETVILDVQRPIGAARERFANDLLNACRAGGTDDHFATMLLTETQRLFERICVGLVHFIADVLLANPRLLIVQSGLPLAGGDLLDADGDLHWLMAYGLWLMAYG